MSYLGRSAKLSRKTQEKTSFLATAGQTTKTGLSYVATFVEVTVNGSLLTDVTDYTATNGNSITFSVALDLNDEVTVVALKTFALADHYSKIESDAAHYTKTAADARFEPIDSAYTKAEADANLAALVDSSPAALNTLNELAAALGDDANFSTTVNNSIALKAPIASPTFTGNFTSTGIDDNATSTAITITSGEDVQFGKTVNDFGATKGTEIRNSDGRVFIGSTDGIFVNRIGSDGNILGLRKDGTTVGSIGTRANLVTIGNGDTGLLFNGTNDSIIPESISGVASRDAAIDLGVSSARFKDLYLSGTAHLDNISHKTSGWNYQDLPAGAGLKTRVGGTDALSLNGFNMTVSSGNLTLGGGNLVIGTSGKGIDFGATGGPASGSTGTSEILDDYEEGTWSPTLAGAVVTSSEGKYTKVGNLVHFQARLAWTSGGSGNIFGGLPYTATTGGGASHSMTVTPYINGGWPSPPTGKGWINGYVNLNSTSIYFYWQPISADATLQASGNVYYQGSYIAA